MAAAAFLEIGPFPGALHTTALATNNHSIAASTSALEVIFQMPEAATITHLGFRYGARTGTPPTYRISLQGVDVSAAAIPDGTVKGGGSPASATFTPPADTTWNGTWQWIALSNSYVCTRGELLALVIDYSSGTIDASNNGTFTWGYSGVVQAAQGLPFAIRNTAGARTRVGTEYPVYGAKSSTTAYGFPLEGSTLPNYSTVSTPDEDALAFQLPAGWGDTYTVGGARVRARVPNTGAVVSMKLYDTDGSTVLQQFDWDVDASAAVNAEKVFTLYFDEVSLSALSCGSTYRLAFVTDTAGWGLRTLDFDGATEADAASGGSAFWLSTRTDAGAWTDTTSGRPCVTLLLADITEPTGGGSVTHTFFVVND